MPDLHLLTDLIVIFGLGVAVVVACHRAKLPPIVGFLITGVLCGPHGFGLIRDTRSVESLAEVGVVLLLFTVGIEVSVQQLVRLRAFLLAGGGLQVGITLGVAAVLGRTLGERWPVAIFMGMLLALSSTAIVLRLLADRGELDSPHGRAALGILIFQDLCIVPMMLLTPLLAGGGGGGGAMLLVAVRAIVFVASAIIAARYVVPWILHQVVATRQREVFLLAVILICLGTAWASSRAGLSLALGAFIAGLIVSESEYSHQALGEILPLREVFNSLFFVSIGMLFDVRAVLAAPVLVIGALIVSIALKGLVTTGVAVTLGQPLRVSLLAGMALAQIGEFSFVLSSAGRTAGLLDERLYQLFLAVAVGTMTITPLLVGLAPRLAAAVERRVSLPGRFGRTLSSPTAETEALTDHVIIVGYGVNGRNLARALGRATIPFVVLELNPETVRAERRRGRPIIYGDAARLEVLDHAGVGRARVIVIAISDAATTRTTVDVARRRNPHLHIVVRSRYIAEMEALRALGTNEVIPEEFETSIEILSRVLRRYLVPRDEIDSMVRQIRGDTYEMFRSMSDTPSAATGLDRFLSNLALEVHRVERGTPMDGKHLGESGLRERSGATVVAIQRAGEELLVNPAGATALAADDIVLLLGKPDQLGSAAPLFRVGER